MKKLLFILSIVLVTSSCSGIPNSAPIKFGQDIKSTDTNQFIQVIGRPPIDGMDQSQIIRGFLSALADSRENYAVARQYLSDEIVSTWRSADGITIYDSATLTVEVTTTGAVANANKFGELDVNGHLLIAPQAAQISQPFGLARNANNEWRISELPDGVLLSLNDIERSFDGYPVYFLSLDKKHLVADTILIPQTLTGSATSLVQALLNGPATKLSLAVSSAFPTGTKLTYGSVPVVDGKATVDLTNQVLSADQPTRALMSAQLVWTLSSLPNVNSIEVRVSGQPLSVTGASLVQSSANWASFNPAQFTGTELIHFTNGNQVFSSGPDGTVKPVVQVDPTSEITLGKTFGSADGTGIAAVSADNKKVLLSTGRGGQFAVVSSGEFVSAPSFDKSGNILFSDYGVGVFEVNSDGQLSEVSFDSTNLASTNQVKQVSIARDGTRVGLVVSDGSTDLLLVGAIVRDENSTRIVGLRQVERTITLIRDLSWQSTTSLAILGSDLSGGNLIFDVNLTFGTSTSISAPLSAQTIASSSTKQIYVGTISGSKSVIAKQSGTLWIDVIEGASPYLAN